MSYQNFVDYVEDYAKKSKTGVKVRNDREKGLFVAKFSGGITMYVNPKTYTMATRKPNGRHFMSKNIREEMRRYETR